jgi:DHA1 family tetracycline resistance protein-like MFS transporter
VRLSFKISFLFRSFLKSCSQAPNAVLTGLFLFVCVGFADGVLTPFFALWAKMQLGSSTRYIGLLLACYSGGELLATPIVGGIADRAGRRPVLLVSTLGVGLGFCLLYFVHGIAASAFVLIFIGVFESVLHPTISTIIADSVPSSRSRHYFSIARVASSTGRIAGPAVGALLVSRSLATVFLASAAALLAGAVVIGVWLPETMPAKASAKGESSSQDNDDESISALVSALRDTRLARILICTFFIEISIGWIGSVLPLYSVDEKTLDLSQVGILFTYAAVLVVIFQPVLSKLLAAVTSSKLVIMSGGVLVATFAVLLISPQVPSLILGVTLLSIAQMLIGPLVPSTINALAPDNARATYMASASVMADLNDTVGPAIGTSLYALSARLPWMLGIPVAACAAYALASTLKRHERSSKSTAAKSKEPAI